MENNEKPSEMQVPADYMADVSAEAVSDVPTETVADVIAGAADEISPQNTVEVSNEVIVPDKILIPSEKSHKKLVVVLSILAAVLVILAAGFLLLVPRKIKFHSKDIVVTLGSSQTIRVDVTPATSEKFVVYESSDEDVLTIENGQIVPVSLGECTIYAKTLFGTDVKCNVTVSVNTDNLEHSRLAKSLDNLGFINSSGSFDEADMDELWFYGYYVYDLTTYYMRFGDCRVIDSDSDIADDPFLVDVYYVKSDNLPYWFADKPVYDVVYSADDVEVSCEHFSDSDSFAVRITAPNVTIEYLIPDDDYEKQEEVLRSLGIPVVFDYI